MALFFLYFYRYYNGEEVYMKENKIFRYIIVLFVLFAAAEANASLPVVLLLIYIIVHIL